jgi:hypothetical protein
VNALALALVAAAAHPGNDAAAAPCKPMLARKAGGEIASLDVDSTRQTAQGRIVTGRLTVLEGMGKPAPGYAATHHLIRLDYTYRCRIRGGRAREASVAPR